MIHQGSDAGLDAVFILNIESQRFSNLWGESVDQEPERSHFHRNLTSAGEKQQNVMHSIRWIRRLGVWKLPVSGLPGSQFLLSSTAELQPSMPKAWEQWKSEHLVTGRSWRPGDLEAWKLRIWQGLGSSSLISLPGEQTVKQGGVQKVGLLDLQLERWAGSKPGTVFRQDLKSVSGFTATSLQLNCLKEEFWFWWIGSSSAGRKK